MATDTEVLRLAVDRSFANTGRQPGTAALAQQIDTDLATVRQGLQQLHQQRHLVLGDDGEDILMAHPFSSVPQGFSVMGTSTLWWGGCAWDAFALPHLLPVSRGPGRHSLPRVRHATRLGRGQECPTRRGAGRALLVPVARIWDDVVRTCGNQRLFCGPGCVDAWLDQTGNPRGYVMDLPTLWRLARHWYDGRLDRGYVRREPAAAAAYFREVGLDGPFWGL